MAAQPPPRTLHFLGSSPNLTPPLLLPLSDSYAFVEFVNARDAEDAYNRIHGRRFRGGTIKVEVSSYAYQKTDLIAYTDVVG